VSSSASLWIANVVIDYLFVVDAAGVTLTAVIHCIYLYQYNVRRGRFNYTVALTTLSLENNVVKCCV
jgi:hypothetical protein